MMNYMDAAEPEAINFQGKETCCLCLDITLEANINIKNPILDACASPIYLISKYFWFELNEEHINNTSSMICYDCLDVVQKFHNLYMKVEQIQHKFATSKQKQQSNSLNLMREEQFELEDLYFNEDQAPNQINDIENGLVMTKMSPNQSKSEINIDKTVQLNNVENKPPNLTIKTTKTVPKRLRKIITERTVQSIKNDQKVSGFMRLTCDLCSIVLVTFGKLKTHFQNVHNINGYAVCCQRKYYKRSLLIDHIDTHLNPEHFKCPTCGKIFTNKESHQTHLRTFHLPERTVYQCDQCPKKFSWRYVLIAHQKTHTPKEEWTYKCKDCDKIFASHTFLSSHRHYVHTVSKKICDLCGKCVSSRVFRKHQLSHTDTGIVQPKVQCEICESWLNKKYIKTHLKNHEEFGSEHICVQCGKRSPNSKALSKHIYEVHTLQKKFKCNVCVKSFKSKELLSQHMPVHTGENNFICPYCPRTFKFKSNAHEHRKKEHPLQFQEDRKKQQHKNSINTNISVSSETVIEANKII